MHLHELTSPQLGKLAPDTPVVVPIAALEQHGNHMPLFTDSLLVGEVARRAAETVGERVLFAPVMWLGNSEHHLDFPGTMSASPRTYLDLLGDMVENLLTHGFRRIVLLNGHGGNIVPSQQALFEVRQRHRQRSDLLLLASTYWTLGSQPDPSAAGLPAKEADPSAAGLPAKEADPSAAGLPAKEADPSAAGLPKEADPSHDWDQQQMGHAGEWETSMMLRLRPELVGDYRACETVPFGEFFRGAARAWITKERTASGHIGSPQLATAEKGEALFNAFTGDVIRLLTKMADWDGASWQ